MKSLDKLTVLSIATVLLDQQAEVTTLEVKTALRTYGFHAKQAEVSEFMADIARTESWEYRDNGTHRSYFTSKGTVTSTPGTAPMPAARKIITTPITSSVVLATKTAGCWEANSVTNSTIMYIDGAQTREQVRQIYKNTHGVKWEDTRSRRVK